MIDERLKEIQERLDKVTPGPWEIVPGRQEFSGRTLIISRDEVAKYMGAVWAPYCEPRPFDANFIAHAREDIPFLLAEIERLKAEISEHVLRADSLRAEVRRLEEEMEVADDQILDADRKRDESLAEVERLTRVIAEAVEYHLKHPQWCYICENGGKCGALAILSETVVKDG